MGILSHDHILPTLDYGTHSSYHYLAMPYMRRGNLRERIAQGSLTQEEAGNILAQIASARNYSGRINGEECFQAEL
jgi:serine/threonine protein kinase